MLNAASYFQAMSAMMSVKSFISDSDRQWIKAKAWPSQISRSMSVVVVEEGYAYAICAS